MKLKMMTKERLVVADEVQSVTLPATNGQLTVLPGHDLFFTELVPGRVMFRRSAAGGAEGLEEFEVGMGCAEVTHDFVSVFVVSARPARRRKAV
jgi:F0F1-type ATP synthase epsilon subunit